VGTKREENNREWTRMDANEGGIGNAPLVRFCNKDIEYIVIKCYFIEMEPARAVLFRKEVYTIVGAALEVLRELGHGIHEKPYERALALELRLRGMSFEQQTPFDITYKRVNVGRFTPDLVVLGKIIVDTKVIDRITNHERGQMLNYLRITRLPVGMILNFRHARLEWERLVSTDRLNAECQECA
jgi:GxxExxY protein